MALGKLAGLVSLAWLASYGSTFAQQGTDAQQREACTPDAFRLCTSAMPDSGRVEACLRGNSPRLSPACYAVFNPPEQQAQTTRQGRAREQREVQRRPERRDDGSRDFEPRDDQPREGRRDDGFGGPQRDYPSRQPQPQSDDE